MNAHLHEFVTVERREPQVGQFGHVVGGDIVDPEPHEIIEVHVLEAGVGHISDELGVDIEDLQLHEHLVVDVGVSGGRQLVDERGRDIEDRELHQRFGRYVVSTFLHALDIGGRDIEQRHREVVARAQVLVSEVGHGGPE